MEMTRKAGFFFTFLTTLVDAAMTYMGFFIAYQLRQRLPYPTALELPPFSYYFGMLAIQIPTMLFVFFLARLYHQKRGLPTFDRVYSIFVAVSVGVIASTAATTFVHRNELDYTRGMVVYDWILTAILVVIGRLMTQTLRSSHQMRHPTHVLLIGAGDIGRMVLQKIVQSPRLGYKVVGFAHESPERHEVAGIPVLGNLSNVGAIIQEHGVKEAIITLPGASHEQALDIISQCERQRVMVRLFPDLFQIIASQVTISDLDGLPLLNVRDVALRGWRLTLKRTMDVAFSAVSLILLSPILLFIALLIKLDSPGPVFYAQIRVGLDGKPFPMLKFRSMRMDAEAETGPVWASENDPRRTRLGSILRRFSVDELPQFINVLVGQMSLVGPRPERPIFVEQFKQVVPRYMDRHMEKAGLTGWAQVNGLRGDTSIIERTKYDIYYIENWSLLFDIKILLKTLGSGLGSKNAY
jgi:exopolysaccharide biosynthesis polyprenyl glycosylphosphotransferase